MRRRSFNRALLMTSAAATLLPSVARSALANRAIHYQKGDTISPEVFVLDKNQRQHTLLSLMRDKPGVEVTLLFLFGGGDMGKGRPGGFWCQDSFNDMHILRTLAARYQDLPVGIIPVSCAPVYSTQYLGFEKRVFLDSPAGSAEYQAAASAFIRSTQAAVDSGIIPMEPWYDLRLRTVMSRAPKKMPAQAAGPVYPWQGGFRAENEIQNYGVPNFWLLDPAGKVLSDPFMGNVYHPHGGSVEINYTLSDIDTTIQGLLS
ncbi:MAG: hypothetical protein V7754_15440 [Halioglobus sp.]